MHIHLWIHQAHFLQFEEVSKLEPKPDLKLPGSKRRGVPIPRDRVASIDRGWQVKTPIRLDRVSVVDQPDIEPIEQVEHIGKEIELESISQFKTTGQPEVYLSISRTDTGTNIAVISQLFRTHRRMLVGVAKRCDIGFPSDIGQIPAQ